MRSRPTRSPDFGSLIEAQSYLRKVVGKSTRGAPFKQSLNLAIAANEVDLREAIRAVIIFSSLTAWSRCAKTGRNPQEPDHIAALVLEGTPLVQNALDLLRPAGISSNILGVYCHQSPYVVFDGASNQRCEIGDLLICHFHFPAAGRPRRNALLLQAKMSHGKPLTLKKKELPQFSLYSQWPTFRYDSPPLTGQQREVLPSSPHTGAQYLTVRSSWQSWRGSTMRIAFPWDPLVSRASLELVFLQLLWGSTGRPFLPYASPAREGWSEVVWDLIHSAARKAFRRESSGIARAPRLVDPGGLDGLWFCRGYDSIQSALESMELHGEVPGWPDAPEFSQSPGPSTPPDEDTAPSLVIVSTRTSD